MKIQTFAQIYPESIQNLNKDYSADTSVLVRSINQVGMSLNQLASNNISLTDNVYTSVQTVSTYHGKALSLKNPYKVAPQLIVVGRVKSPSNVQPAGFVNGAVQVLDWTVDSNNAIIIAGLNSDGTPINGVPVGLVGLPNVAGVPIQNPDPNAKSPYIYQVTLVLFY